MSWILYSGDCRSLNSFCSSCLNTLGKFTEDVREILAPCSRKCSSSNPLKVTILAPKWKDLGRLAMIRELAKQLAKFPQLKVTVLIPENSGLSEQDKREEQSRYKLTIVEVKKQPGFVDPIEWLNFPPADLSTDIVVGCGKKLSKIAHCWKKQKNCKSIHIFSDLFIDYLLSDLKHKIESYTCNHDETMKGLCEVADICVATGPKMTEKLSASLRYKNKKVFNLTPGIISEFRDLTHVANDGWKFRVLLVGGDKPDNFQKEGLDIAAKAVTELNDKSYHLIYNRAGEGNMEQFAHNFHNKYDISKVQLDIRSLPKDDEEWKSLFCEVDLAIVPSGEKEFGLEALLALSAGLPVLVHGDSGFGEALKKLKFGTLAIVDSEDAAVWASEIKKVRKTDRKQQLEQAKQLHSQYNKRYSWKRQCEALVRMMLKMCSGNSDVHHPAKRVRLPISDNYSNDSTHTNCADDEASSTTTVCSGESSSDLQSDVQTHNSASSSIESDQEEGNTPLCDGSPVTARDFIAELYALVRRHNLSPQATDSILKLMKRSLPEGNKCPASRYQFEDECINVGTGANGEELHCGQGFGASSGTFTRQTGSRAAGQWNSSYHHNQNRFEVLSGSDSVFGGQHSRPTDSEQLILQTIKGDMEIWERSQQWPLSCYTYTKEEPSFQGLQDFSPEEIRLEAYTANAKGTADTYEHGLKLLISAYQKRRHDLSKMSVSQIKDEIKKNSRLHESAHVMDAGSGVFGGTAGSFSQLGGANASSFVTQSSGLRFGAGNPVNQSGLFGQTSVTLGNSGTVFGGLPTTGTLFGSSPDSGTTFSGSSQTSYMKITSQSGGLFGASPAGPSPDGGSLFGSSSPAISSERRSTASISQTVGNRIDSQSRNVSANSLKSNVGTSSGIESSTVVSSKAKHALTCSEQDMQAFMADSFVLGKIPECPPPLELC